MHNDTNALLDRLKELRYPSGAERCEGLHEIRDEDWLRHICFGVRNIC
jgi:hypothetical protein